jgi:CBS-domain-containing membrane protein
MTEKLARRGMVVSTDLAIDVLGTWKIRDVMTTDVVSLGLDATTQDAIDMIATTGHGAFPIVSQGKLAGIVSRSDLFRQDRPRPEQLAEVVRTDVVVGRPDETLRTAVERMLEEGVEHLPVIDDHGRLVGVCTRTDILMSQQRTDDRRQTGWRPPVPRRRR